MNVPTIGESITEVTLSQWLVEDGAYINIDEPICEFESDKATLEFPAEAAGKVIYVAAEGDDLEIGALVAKIDTSAAKPAEAAAPEESQPEPQPTAETTPAAPTAPAQPAAASYAAGHPSPAAGKILRENNINPASVQGTGKDGRITKQDALTAKSAPSRLVAAKNETAMLTTFNEVDLTNIQALRKTYQEKFVEKYGVKLGYMSLFAKACAMALMEYPGVNAQIDGNEVIYHDYADISIAISTPTGLVVPPVHNVESLSFADIEKKIKALAVKAREGKLTLDEMSGGTFTITNGGIFGSMMSTPIINRPQSAILGMHSIMQRPIAVDGEVKIRPMMYLAMSYDHRIIDGSTSVTFLVKVKELLEDPTTLLMGL